MLHQQEHDDKFPQLKKEKEKYGVNIITNKGNTVQRRVHHHNFYIK